MSDTLWHLIVKKAKEIRAILSLLLFPLQSSRRRMLRTVVARLVKGERVKSARTQNSLQVLLLQEAEINQWFCGAPPKQFHDHWWTNPSSSGRGRPRCLGVQKGTCTMMTTKLSTPIMEESDHKKQGQCQEKWTPWWQVQKWDDEAGLCKNCDRKIKAIEIQDRNYMKLEEERKALENWVALLPTQLSSYTSATSGSSVIAKCHQIAASIISKILLLATSKLFKCKKFALDVVRLFLKHLLAPPCYSPPFLAEPLTSDTTCIIHCCLHKHH